MNKSNFFTLFFALFITMPVMAFTTDADRIDSYLELLAKPGMELQKKTMIERLQWSGLSDPSLFDPIEKYLLDNAKVSSTQFKLKRDLMAHMLRSLGYSGNEKYRPTLNLFNKDAASGKLRKYARKALSQLGQFGHWNSLIAVSDAGVEGKSAEVTTYMKMLNTGDAFVQRLAARAMFHEGQKDPDLLALAAEKLKGMYLDSNLSSEAQDTTAWLCKAIGVNGNAEYGGLLKEVSENSPHRRVKKHASKYVN